MLLQTVVGAILSLLSPAVHLDFATAATGQRYCITLVVKDVAGKVLVSGPLDIGQAAGAGDIRDVVADSLGDSGLRIEPVGATGVRIASDGKARLGSITYETSVGGVGAPALAGPKVLGRVGVAKVSVNGVALNPSAAKP